MFVLLRKVVDQALRIFRLERDHPRELPGEVQIVLVKALLDKVRVILVLGKKDRLSEPVAARDLESVRHQVGERLVHGVDVEEPFVDRVRLDEVRRAAVLAPLFCVPLLLLLVGQFVVGNALPLELERHRDGYRWHQELVSHRVGEIVGVGGNASFEIEESVSVAVDLVARRGGEPDEQRVEIFEDRAVFLIHRAMRLVDDDEVEVPRAEAPLAVFRFVDQPHDRGIGRDEHPALGVLFGDEIHRRRLGQEFLEGVHRLVHQRHAVGEEKHALHPVAAHEQIGQRDHRARLARAGGHHHQRLAILVFLTIRVLCTASWPLRWITRALVKTASPATALKVGSWISALRLS